MPKIAVVCLMRKGSKRFPGKNIAPLFGIPLYLWTINFFQKFDYPFYLLHDYDKLYIPEWVTEIKRDPYYSGDIHKTDIEIKWANIDADIYILAQVTSPFRDYEYIQAAIKQFIDCDYDSGFNAYIQNSGLYYNERHKPLNFSREERDYNKVSKQQVYKETGSFYIFKKKMLNKKHILYSDNVGIFTDPYNIDIDTEEDLRAIECKLK